MITKLAKAKDNWFFKLISAAVVVSFVSLFGVTGYISSAAQNQTVVKIGHKKVTQSEFSYRVQKELNALRNLAGDDYELTDEMRNTITDRVLKQIIDENVLDLSMEKFGVYFPKAFVQQVIFSQPEFTNPVNGQFHPEIFRRYLSSIGMSEQEYVDMVKRSMARKMLVTDLVKTFAVPQVLEGAIHKMDNQRRTFKYTQVSPLDVKIERQISDDEIAQYFADFGERFMIPETRSVKLVYIPNDKIVQKYVANDDLAEDYFKQHKSELDQPEKRDIAQMVFTDKNVAEQALAAVQNGDDFVQTAKKLNAENANETDLGVVSQDELANDLALGAFALKVNEPKLLQVADSWQVIVVKDIIPAKKAVFEEVKAQILETLAEENLYDALHDAKADIDDAVNGGKNLDDVASLFDSQVIDIKDIEEEKIVENLPKNLSDLASLDFNNLVFSYGLDEITSAEEFDNGIAVVQITDIIDAHMPEIDDVRDEIVALWTIQEKDALAKEIADNIVADVEDGSDLAVAAKARDLEAFRSEPINRNETFAKLAPNEISELFLAEEGAVKVFEHPGNVFVIAVPLETVNFQDELSDDAKKAIEVRAEGSLLSDMSQAVLDSYAKDFKIKIDYQRAGFAE